MRTARVLTVSHSMLCTGGVYLVWGVPGPGGVYLVPGGVVSGTPPCEQNDRQVQKYYLAPNFVCGR